MPKISVYIPVLNEEDKIESALKSVSWADEIIILDSGCTDKTLEIARLYTDKIVPHKFSGFGHLRNDGIDACTHEWILSLDADEQCSPELAKEIRHTLESSNIHDAYWIPRRNWFMGRWIKHCGWYPDYCQPKLFRKKSMRYCDEDEVHEGWNVQGSIGFLKRDILHFSFQNLSRLICKIDHYSDLGAQKIARNHKKSSITLAFSRALWAFFRIYILKSGFLDGNAGLIIAISNAQATFYRYAKHAWQQNNWHQPPPCE